MHYANSHTASAHCRGLLITGLKSLHINTIINFPGSIQGLIAVYTGSDLVILHKEYLLP